MCGDEARKNIMPRCQSDWNMKDRFSLNKLTFLLFPRPATFTGISILPRWMKGRSQAPSAAPCSCEYLKIWASYQLCISTYGIFKPWINYIYHYRDTRLHNLDFGCCYCLFFFYLPDLYPPAWHGLVRPVAIGRLKATWCSNISIFSAIWQLHDLYCHENKS